MCAFNAQSDKSSMRGSSVPCTWFILHRCITACNKLSIKCQTIFLCFHQRGVQQRNLPEVDTKTMPMVCFFKGACTQMHPRSISVGLTSELGTGQTLVRHGKTIIFRSGPQTASQCQPITDSGRMQSAPDIACRDLLLEL